MRKLINNKEKHVIKEMSSKVLNNWIKTAESTNVGRPYKIPTYDARSEKH